MMETPSEKPDLCDVVQQAVAYIDGLAGRETIPDKLHKEIANFTNSHATTAEKIAINDALNRKTRRRAEERLLVALNGGDPDEGEPKTGVIAQAVMSKQKVSHPIDQDAVRKLWEQQQARMGQQVKGGFNSYNAPYDPITDPFKF